jgi:hypothetical protein
LVIRSSGQQIKIEGGYGLGSYTMTDLKKMNTSVLETLPVEAGITDNFPVRPYYYLSIDYNFNPGFSIGLTGNYNTTGSRISYKDYSGELIFDNILSSYSPGIQLSVALVDKKFKISEVNNISCSLSRLKIKEKVISSSEEYKYKSNSIQFEPGIKVSFPFSRFEIGAKAGYLLDLKGINRLKGDRDTILKDTKTGDEIKTNWSGFRISISIAMTIHGFSIHTN